MKGGTGARETGDEKSFNTKATKATKGTLVPIAALIMAEDRLKAVHQLLKTFDYGVGVPALAGIWGGTTATMRTVALSSLVSLVSFVVKSGDLPRDGRSFRRSELNAFDT